MLLSYRFRKEISADINFTKNKSNGSLTWLRYRLPWHCHRCFSRIYNTTIFVYTLPRLNISIVHRSAKKKWFHMEKGNKQTIFIKINDMGRRRTWPRISGKYTSHSGNSFVQPKPNSRRHWRPCEDRKKANLFQTKRNLHHFKMQAYKTSGQVVRL